MDSQIDQIKKYRDIAKQRLLENNEKEAISYAIGSLFTSFELASTCVLRQNIMFPNRDNLFSTIHRHEKGQVPVQSTLASKELENLEEAVLCNLLGIDFLNYFRFKAMVTTKPAFGGEYNLLSSATYKLGSISFHEVVDYCTFTTDLILNKLTEFDRPFSFKNN